MGVGMGLIFNTVSLFSPSPVGAGGERGTQTGNRDRKEGEEGKKVLVEGRGSLGRWGTWN